MNLQVDVERISLAQKTVRAELLAELASDGRWVGQLASSPFATASAISALVLAHRRGTAEAMREESASGAAQVAQHIVQGDLCELLLESVQWLARHQNADGGWGDCERGQSNLAATLLVQAALRLTGIPAKYADLMARADQYIAAHGGIAGLRQQFESDKTLVAAVLANAALADMVAWRQVPTLAFETVCLPKFWRHRLPLPASPAVLPAYVAVGRAKFQFDPPKNPIARLLRRSLRAASLSELQRLQAGDGGFVNSTPITSFVVMCLATTGYQEHAVVQRGIEFLLASVQSDASWRVEHDFSTWNTTLAVTSLMGPAWAATPREGTPGTPRSSERSAAAAPPLPLAAWEDTARLAEGLDETAVVGGLRTADAGQASHEIGEQELELQAQCLPWLLDAQQTRRDLATHVAPGGWGRSATPGALPNALDTASALLALARFGHRFADSPSERTERSASMGVGWLIDLQNADGGWPAFSWAGNSKSRGESGNDATAFALRALAAWQTHWQAESGGGGSRSDVPRMRSIDSAIARGWRYLESQQREDGSFVPAWFGNEHHPRGENPVFGTAHVLLACADLCRLDHELAARAVRWLLAAQHASGGWGPPRAPLDYSGAYKDGFRAWRANDALAKFCSVEETALAVSALLPLAESSQGLARAVANGLSWLASAVEQDTHRQGAVIGLYFSRLWYHERLSPLVYAAGALTLATRQLEAQRQALAHIG